MTGIGILIGVMLFVGIKYLLYFIDYMKWGNSSPDERQALKLSPDKKPEQYLRGYIIYANNTRWYFESFVTWKLYWIPLSAGDDIEKLLKQRDVEFQCTWLPRRKMFKIIRRIIFTHPNLDLKGKWRAIKFFE
jgi:hypothetical protein